MRCRRRFDPCSCHFLLFLFSSSSSSLSLLSFKTRISLFCTKLFLSWLLSAAFLLSLVPVLPGCSLSFSLLSVLSPSDQPPSTVSVRTIALKLVTKPILFESAEWSERLTSRRVGWLGAAVVGSIRALVTSFSFFSLLLLLLLLLLFLSSLSKPVFLLSTPVWAGVLLLLPSLRRSTYAVWIGALGPSIFTELPTVNRPRPEKSLRNEYQGLVFHGPCSMHAIKLRRWPSSNADLFLSLASHGEPHERLIGDWSTKQHCPLTQLEVYCQLGLWCALQRTL